MKFNKLFCVEFNANERVFGLDLMRSFAIFLVVFVHGDMIIRNAFPAFPKLDFIDGVDIFFVLSGFLIGSILIRNFSSEKTSINTLGNFWKRRWFRTLPNYYLILVILLIFDFSEYTSANNFNYKYLFFLQNLSNTHPSFFNVAWSLCVEEWFYILFPLTLLISRKIFKNIEFINLFVILVFVFISFSTAYRFYLENNIESISLVNHQFESYSRKILLARFDTIMMGVFGAWISFYHPELWKKHKYKSLFLGVSFILISHFFNKGIWMNTLSLNLTSFGLLLILPFFSQLNLKNKWYIKPITSISIVSYSVYLIHFSIVLVILLKLNTVDNKLISLGLYLIYFIISYLLSMMLYKYFEKPLTNLRDK